MPLLKTGKMIIVDTPRFSLAPFKRACGLNCPPNFRLPFNHIFFLCFQMLILIVSSGATNMFLLAFIAGRDFPQSSNPAFHNGLPCLPEGRFTFDTFSVKKNPGEI